MKNKYRQFCLMLLLSPFMLHAQDAGGDAAKDTFSSPPVTTPFISFQAQTRDSKVVVQWEVKEDSADYFTLERSTEGKNYEAIGILKAAANLHKYEFIDEFPARGQAYYRVRYTRKSGSETYSESHAVLLPGSTFFRFYPNPTDKLLILRVECPFDLQIVDGFGKQRITKSLGLGPQVIDVSFLEKGVYIIRITDKISGRQQFDKFLKN